MTKGYLLFAIDTDTVDYSRLAYACALSIKISQSAGSNAVALVTNSDKQFNIPVFDQVIKYTGPEGMDARSRAFDYTPFDQTILLDSDMLVLRNVSHYWNIFNDLFITTCPQTFRSKRFRYGYYRKLFEQYNLIDVYNAFTYFEKSETSREFFDLVKIITDHPKEYINSFLPECKQHKLYTDEAFALALKILDLEDTAVNLTWDFPRITHMKPNVQGWYGYFESWSADRLRFSLDEQAKVKIGVWQQSDILHYVDKDLIIDEIVETMEQQYERLLHKI